MKLIIKDYDVSQIDWLHKNGVKAAPRGVIFKPFEPFTSKMSS